jgi:hypothetical protein
VSFKHVRNTYFLINVIKKVCEKHVLLKQHVLLTCRWTHIHLICELYEILDKGDVVASSNLPCAMYQNDTMYPVLLVYIRSDLSKKEKKKTTLKKKKKLASDKNSGDSLESPLHGSVKVNWDSVVDRHKIKISISVVVRDSMSEVLPMLSEPKIT